MTIERGASAHDGLGTAIGIRRRGHRPRSGTRQSAPPRPAPSGEAAPRTFPTRPPLQPLITEFTAACGFDWAPKTRRKHRDDFERFLAWLRATGHPATTAALELPVLAAYVDDLMHRPRIPSALRGNPRARELAAARGATTLSANSVNAYVRPLRAFVMWLVDEGHLASDPFRRARRRSGPGGLLPREETPTKGATRADLETLARGCAGGAPIDLRDRAVVAVLVTTAARNSSVRLLKVEDVDFERGLLLFRRAKGRKTLEIALHPTARAAITAYLERGRPALVPGNDLRFVFPALHGGGGPMTTNALSGMLTKRYRAGGGTLPYFGSHRIRHATATLLVNNGMPLDEVSRYLGHASTAVTLRYATITPETLGNRAAAVLARAGVVGAEL